MAKKTCLGLIILASLALLTAAAAPGGASQPAAGRAPISGPQAAGRSVMKLSHICIITDNLERLKKFYRDILQLEPREFKGDYVEFPTEGAVLSLFDLASHEKLAPGTMRARANHSIEVEFQVRDVDQEYARLKKLDWPIVWILPPTTLSWGNRSIYFRDPDGNFLNFFSVVESP